MSDHFGVGVVALKRGLQGDGASSMVSGFRLDMCSIRAGRVIGVFSKVAKTDDTCLGHDCGHSRRVMEL